MATHQEIARPEERFPSVPHILNLQWLEDFLGVKLETCGERVKLSAAVLQRLKETVDQDGNSLLMRAAREGNFECVDLLLRCGAQVNASRTIDGEEQRAIDFSDERGYKSIVKLLIQWDSVMPCSYEEYPEDWLASLAEADEYIEKLLQRREDFHEKVREGDVNGIREMVSSGEGKDYSSRHPRYLVNRKGHSALLTAASDGKQGVLTLLIRLNFQCLEHEKSRMEFELKQDENKRREYESALIHNMEPIKVRHISMMAWQSFMRKGEVHLIRDVYEAADKVREARVLMQCLQHEPDLEVIFDTENTNVTCMYLSSSSGVPGVYDPYVHRVYASAALDSWSDTVSNLVHELAHVVMHVVFENGGLPYLKDDQERIQAYNNIVSNILSEENIRHCNIIIKRVREFYTENYYPHEVVVRVPEILTKIKVEGDDGESSEPWRNDHERELFHFYSERVDKDILSWNETKSKANTLDFISRPARDVIVVGNIETPRPTNHNNIIYLQVSNLALGVSHVKKSLRDTVLVVDWAEFSKKKRPIEINLKRRNITHMVVVWDEGMGNQFCEQSENCSKNCPAYELSSIKEYVTFIVPKSFIISGGNHPIEYKWEHLSTKTKEWILGSKVGFQGKYVTLKEMINNVTEGSDVESIMSKITDSDVIAWLIDGQKMTFGTELKSQLGIRGDDFNRNHPETCIERTMEMRKINLKWEILRRRDAIFFTNAKESDLREMNVGAVSYWNSENVPDGANCFLLDEHQNSQTEKEMCDRICDQMRHSGREWPYAHFFRFRQGKHTHVLTRCMTDNRCRLLAVEPGCGKTVFVYDAALKEKEKYPERWMEVVELSKCGKVLEQWKEYNTKANGSVEEFLYNLITIDLAEKQPNNMEIERKIFKHFCQANGKASLFFHGYDEICPRYKHKFSSFLKNLLKESKVIVLVTSTMNDSQYLEEILNTFVNHLVPSIREEQITYLSKVWNALLKSVQDSKRAEKLTSVISNLRAHSVSGEKYGKVIENLESHSEDPSVLVDFSEVAEEVIGMCKSSVEGEGYLSGVLLDDAEMIASVYYEDNFRLHHSSRLYYFYTRFVTAKLKKYCSGKVEHTGHQVEEGFLSSVIENLRQNLKKFAASVFLRNQTYQPEETYLFHLDRAGFLIEKSGKYDFKLINLGEISFSDWILEKAKDQDVTRILLQNVLLDIEFEKVREFIDEILLSTYQNTSSNGEECICEISDPSQMAFDDDEELSILFRKCFHRAVSSCHRGIIKYLAKSWEERIADALFSMRVCHCGEATEKYNDRKKRHNAFLLKNSFELKSRDVETIQSLLILTEGNRLIEKLGDFISEYGLKWAGINEESLWRNEECRASLLRIIEFFANHSDKLRKEIRDKILRKEYLEFLKYFSLFSFNEWKCFLNSVVGENCFGKLLVPSSGDDFSIYSPMTDIWFYTVTKGSVENVSEMWDLIKGHLESNMERKAFLLRKDEDGRNCLFSSILFNNDFQVVMFVWKQFEKEFPREDLKEFIFDKFESNMFNFDLFEYQSARNMTDWLNHITAGNVICLNNSVELLRKIRFHKFTIGGWLPVQEFLMAAGGDEEARGEVKGFLEKEGISGFECPLYDKEGDYYHSPEFRSIVQREWGGILPDLSPHLPTRPIPFAGLVREVGAIPVQMTTMVTYLLFSWRQFKLISKYFTSSDLMQSALKEYFRGMFGYTTRYLGSESIPFVFSVPTAFFSKEEIYKAFLKSKFHLKIDGLETEVKKYILQFPAA